MDANPLSLKRIERIIKYWFKILNLDNCNRIEKMYDVDKGLTTSNYVYFIKNLLFKYGFGYAWLQQTFLDQKCLFRILIMTRRYKLTKS